MSKYILLTQIEIACNKEWWESDKVNETIEFFESFEEAKAAMREAVSTITKKYEETQIALRNKKYEEEQIALCNTPSPFSLLPPCDRCWPFSEGGNLIDKGLQSSNKSIEKLNELITKLICDPKYVSDDIEAFNVFDEDSVKHHIVIGNADCIICSLNKAPHCVNQKCFLRMNIHNMFDDSKSYYFCYYGVNIRLINTDTLSTAEIKKEVTIPKLSGSIFLGNYMNNAAGTLFAPIQWTVIKTENNLALLLSKNVIDYLQFSATCEVDWEHSDLRQWLNSTFIDIAFNEQEKAILYEKNFGEKVFLMDETMDINDYRIDTSCTSYTRKKQQMAPDVLPDSWHYPSRFSFWIKDSGGEKHLAKYKRCGNGHYDWSTQTAEVTKYGGVRPMVWVKIKDLLELGRYNSDRK